MAFSGQRADNVAVSHLILSALSPTVTPRRSQGVGSDAEGERPLLHSRGRSKVLFIMKYNEPGSLKVTCHGNVMRMQEPGAQ